MIVRPGAVYLAVLMSSLIVASLALSAITSAQYFARDLNDEGDFRRAQIAADAALEWAIADINATTNWRMARVHNIDTATQQLGTAYLRYRLLDDDGDLADNSQDACDVLVTATVGKACCAWRATLEPAGASLKCLNYALATQQDIEPQSFAMWCSDGIVGSGDKITVNGGASLTADCQHAGAVSGTVYGTLTPLVGGLEIPNSSLLEQYAQQAVSITASQLPNSLGTLVFDKHLLSANANTVSGNLSSNGIYVIDCEGNSIVISNSRLQCTLVLKNVGSTCKLNQSVYWEAARANYPALLVGGDFELSMTKNTLQESTLGVNLNPPGTPYRGVEDSSLSTTYPSQIRGLIYASGRIKLDNILSENEVYGVLIGSEKIRGSGDLFLNYRNLYTLNPPPGFRQFDKVRIAAGSARRVAAP